MKRSVLDFESLLDDVAESVATTRVYRKESAETDYSPLYRRAALVTDFLVDELGLQNVQDEEAGALMDLSSPSVGDEGISWVMPDELRRRVLDQMHSEGSLQEELKSLPARPKNDLQNALEQLINDTVSLEGSEEVEPLAALQIAANWFSESPASVTEEAIRGRIRWLNLIKPFKDLVGGNFQGREEELKILSDYVGVLDASGWLEASRRTLRSIFSIRDEPPLMIHGPGGIGKSTLLASFILKHAGAVESGRLPFVYIDFDRSRISPERPLSLMFDALDQMEAQYPDDASHFGGLRESWSRALESNQKSRSATRSSDPTAEDFMFDLRARVVSEFVKALEVIGISDRPFLLFLDTFEGVRFSSDSARTVFWSLLDRLQEEYPYLRIVISGRAPVGDEPDAETSGKHEFDLRTRKRELEGLPLKAAKDYLKGADVDKEDAEVIAKRITPKESGVSPLSLRVAATVWHRRREQGDTDIVNNDFWADLQAGRIQDQLIERYLDHLGDGDLQQLVNPGFVLRRINKTLIRNVLAEPCGIDIANDDEAQELFDDLRSAIDLVTTTDESAEEVVPRTEVRRVILSLLEELETKKVAKIHANARSWYEKASDEAENLQQSQLTARMRAEELYHRLMLGGEDSVIQDRWLESAAEYLSDCDDELKPPGLALLKTLRKEQVSKQLKEAASLLTWEAAIVNQVESESGAEKRLELVTQRPERSYGSRVYALHAKALDDLRRPQEALAVVEEGLESFTPEASSSERCDLLLLGAEVSLQVGDVENARWMLASAKAIARQREDPRRLLRVGLAMSDTVEKEPNEKLKSQIQRDADDLVVKSLVGQGHKALRSNLDLIVRLIASSGHRLPEVVMAGIRGGVLEQLDESELRDLARSMAAYDRRSSAAQGQRAGHVALEVGIPFEGNANEAWQSFFANLITIAPTVLDEAFSRFGSADAEPFLLRVGDAVSRGLSESSALAAIVNADSSGSNWWPWKRVGAKQLSTVVSALLTVVDVDQLRELLNVGLDIRLETLASSREGSEETLYQVVREAHRQGWLDGLMMVARFARPESGRLLEVSNDLGTGTLGFDGKDLERLRRSHPELTLTSDRLAEMDPRVCRVTLDGATRGTGFLVSPDMILSSYHVLEPLVDTPNAAIEFNFDFAVSRNGQEIHSGTSYPAASTYPRVFKGGADDGPGPDVDTGLVVVRTKGFPGDDPVGGKTYSSMQPTRRGWVEIRHSPAIDQPAPGVVLFHYPEGRCLTAEIEEESATRRGDRLAYIADTASGSAGAPIFDSNLNFLGLHQGRNGQQSWGTPAIIVLEELANLGVLESIGVALT